MRTKKTAGNSQEAFDVPITFSPMIGVGGGFRTEWVTGKGHGVEFGLDSGAGVGNPYLTFWIEKNGKRAYYTSEIRDLVNALVVKTTSGKSTKK